MQILGVDFGKKYVGIAITQGYQAHSLTRFNTGEALVRLVVLVKKENIEKVVIGMPEGKLAQDARVFGEQVAAAIGKPVVYWDETLTTQHAQKELIGSGRSRKRRKRKEHEVAACLILESFLDTQK